MTYPHDWQEMTLGDLGHIQMCRRIFQSQTKTSGDIPFYKIGTFGGEADAYIPRKLYEHYKNKYPYPAKGDILISAAGTIGKTIVFDGKDAYFQDSNIVWLKVNEKLIDRQFLFWFCRSFPWRSLEGSTIQRLYNGIILGTKIFLPPLAEQKAIAETLATFDEYIDALAALIVKKKNIRDGALENLMSCKIRLPGFCGDWKRCKINEVTNRFDNLRIPVTANKRTKGNIPYYGANGIQDYVAGYTHDGEYVLIAEDGANDLKNYPVQYVSGKIWVNNHAHVLQGKNNFVDNKFLAYALRQINFESVLVGGTRAKLNAKILMEIEIHIPTLDEQKAIAEVLSAMDEEIEALTAEREKIIALRAGAMDELLTGKIRLKLEA